MAILGKSLTNRVSHILPLDVGSNPKIVSYESRETVAIFLGYTWHMILLLWHHCSKNHVTVSYISQLFLQKDSETPHFRTTLNTSSHPLPILFPSSSVPISVSPQTLGMGMSERRAWWSKDERKGSWEARQWFPTPKWIVDGKYS